jgi:3-methylcrotonyl-CoA carboxylase beta subunit
MAKLLLHPIGAELSAFLSPDEAGANAAAMAGVDAALAAKVATVHAGWGPKYAERVREKGKLPTWDRIERLKDPGTEVFEVGTLVNWGRKFAGSKLDAPGAGVVCCFTRVHGRWTMVIANDNTVASGAWWPQTPEKIERAQEMALRLRIPVIYLVDCSGLFLPEQSRSFAGARGAGHIFKKNALLAANGVPQLAGVFGDCIAGGGYMPIISDRVYMTEAAYMVIAGAALIRGAKSLKLTSLDIGGPEVHVHQSACADERVPDDETAIDGLRDEVGRLPSPALGFYRYGADPGVPVHDPAELASVFPADFRQGYDIEQVLARLVDHGLFHEVLTDVGRELVTGLARIDGLWMAFIANRQGLIDEPGIGRRPGGAIYREGIAKISAFSRACSDDGIPLVWLQDISGFDIGVEAERLGLLGYGSNLIYSNSTATNPTFVVLLRKASGAGYYAMCGLPYDPIVQLSTPISRLGVMEGRTLAIATYNSRLDDDFEIASHDPAERAEIERGMRDVAARIDADMDPIDAASRMDTDEVVPLARLRAWLECLAQAAWQQTGYRRTKNPRIWSMHDLAVLRPNRHADASRAALRVEDQVQSSTVGQFFPSVGVGATVHPRATLGVIVRAGRAETVLAPEGSPGVVIEMVAAGAAVEHGTALLRLGDRVESQGSTSVQATAASDLPEGVAVLHAETDGTIYLSPDPTKPAFVVAGDRVEPRATIALIEVMKTFTPVRAAESVVIERVLVSSGASVTQGQALFWVRHA